METTLTGMLSGIYGILNRMPFSISIKYNSAFKCSRMKVFHQFLTKRNSFKLIMMFRAGGASNAKTCSFLSRYTPMMIDSVKQVLPNYFHLRTIVKKIYLKYLRKIPCNITKLLSIFFVVRNKLFGIFAKRKKK